MTGTMPLPEPPPPSGPIPPPQPFTEDDFLLFDQNLRTFRDWIKETVLEALAEQRHSSVELARTAAGATTVAVKQYGATVLEAYELAHPLYTRACAEHPFAKPAK